MGSPPPRRTVLAIDDDPGVLNLYLSMLSPAGYRVLCCNESTKAVELIQKERPDVVLCDIVMPGLDGYEVHAALEADPANAGVAFIFLTAQGDFSERVRAFEAGVVDFMTKPFTQGILLRKVEKVLARAGRPAAPAAAAKAGASTGRRAVSFDDIPAEFRRVLIMDDDRDYRQWLRQLLEPHGFTVIECEDGPTALQRALEERPWLFLADVNMPEMDGFEVCRRFRAQPMLRSIPFVFLSGLDDYEERRKGLEMGADEYLPKILPQRELLMRIRLVLQRVAASGAWTRRGPGMAGDMEVIGPAGALQMCHLSQLTGLFEVVHDGARAEIRFREGAVVGARCGDREGAEAVFEFLGWNAGRFEFTPGDPGPGTPLAESVTELVLEGARRLDERRR